MSQPEDKALATRVSAQTVIGQAADWLEAGQRVALATVFSTWGSSPRPVGSQLVTNERGEFAGSVSGGCIEGNVIEQCQQIAHTGVTRILEYSVSDEQAWGVGLTCGGTVVVLICALVDRAVVTDLYRCQQQRKLVALLIHCENAKQVVFIAGKTDASLRAVGLDPTQLYECLLSGASGPLAAGAEQWFCRVFMPSLRLVVIGAVHISQVLVPMARLAGFHVTLVDPRVAFATATRFVDTRIVRQWPDRYFESEPLDADTAVVSLSHDSKIDDLALIAALKSPACYVGSLGSRKTHARRLSRLEDAGMTPAALARIHAPIGLDLGGRSASDIAIAILAEIVSVRSGPGSVSKLKEQHD